MSATSAGDAGVGSTPASHDVHPGAGQPGRHRGGEELTRGAGSRPTPHAGGDRRTRRRSREHVRRRDREVEGELRGEVPVGQPRTPSVPNSRATALLPVLRSWRSAEVRGAVHRGHRGAQTRRRVRIPTTGSAGETPPVACIAPLRRSWTVSDVTTGSCRRAGRSGRRTAPESRRPGPSATEPAASAPVLSACCTAAPCGPSSDRPSCAPWRARRGSGSRPSSARAVGLLVDLVQRPGRRRGAARRPGRTMPPPWMRAITSKRPSSSVTLNGSLTSCWCTLFGK